MRLNDGGTLEHGRAQCSNCAVRNLVLFADLDDKDFAVIRRPIRRLQLDVGAILYQPGDPSRHVYTLRSGVIKLMQYLPDGSRRIVRVLKPGDLAGTEVLLGEDYQHTAEALQPASLCAIPVGVIERLDDGNPHLHRQLMARLQRALQQADFWITELSTGTAHARVARLLIWMWECCGHDELHLPSREDIGAMLGLTTETVSRVIAELKREGLIAPVNSHRIRIDIPGLKHLATE